MPDLTIHITVTDKEAYVDWGNGAKLTGKQTLLLLRAFISSADKMLHLMQPISEENIRNPETCQ